MPSRINPGARQYAGRVAPFGHPQIAGCQRLPGAFRRVAASFIGRRRQGIHHAPIIAAIPRSLTRRGQSPPDQEPNRRAPKRPESLGPPVASRPSSIPVASTPCRRSLKIVVPRRNSDIASEQLLFSFVTLESWSGSKSMCAARGRGSATASKPHPRPRDLGDLTLQVVNVLVQRGKRCEPSYPGGAAGIRTPDLRRARAALSRLSYGPSSRRRLGGRAWTRTRDLGLIRAAL